MPPIRFSDDAPDDDAYSRVSRDLAAVTAPFGQVLDRLPATLVTKLECRRRTTTMPERQRLLAVTGPLESSFAIEPDGPGRASLLLGRASFEGGVQAVVAVGSAVAEPIPDCFCDACDQNADSMIEQLDELVALAVGGFHEFRRPHVARPGDLLHHGPWMEQGYESGDRHDTTASADVRGDAFSVHWRPWRVR